MRLFYLAAFGPTGREVVWDRMVVAADEEAARAFAQPYLPIGYAVGRIREMPLPPSIHVEDRELLGMPGTTVKEWWTIWSSVQSVEDPGAAETCRLMTIRPTRVELNGVDITEHLILGDDAVASLNEEEPS